MNAQQRRKVLRVEDKTAWQSGKIIIKLTLYLWTTVCIYKCFIHLFIYTFLNSFNFFPTIKISVIAFQISHNV